MSEREELKKLRKLVREILAPLMEGDDDIDAKAVAERALQTIGGDQIKTTHPRIYLVANHFFRNLVYGLLRKRPKGEDTDGAQQELPFPDCPLVRDWYPRAHKKGQPFKWAHTRNLELEDAKWNVANWDREIDPMIEHKEQFIKVCVTELGFPEREFRKKDGGEAVDVG